MKKQTILLVVLISFVALFISCNKSASGSAGDAVQETNQETESSEPSNDCEEFIQDYRQWADRYDVLANKLKENPSDMSTLNEFTTMANEISTWQTRTPDCSDSKYIEQLNEIGERILKTAETLAQ